MLSLPHTQSFIRVYPNSQTHAHAPRPYVMTPNDTKTHALMKNTVIVHPTRPWILGSHGSCPHVAITSSPAVSSIPAGSTQQNKN